MIVKLLADYRGWITNEVFYPAGQHDIDDNTAIALVKNGRAEYVAKPEMDIVEPPKLAPKRRTRKAKAE